MASIPRAEFARGLRRLSAREAASLVADLWAARGWETDRRGTTVVATRDDGTPTRRFRVLGEPLPLTAVLARSERADAVVARGPVSSWLARVAGGRVRGGPRAEPLVLGGDDLYERLVYAAGEDAREAILARYFEDGRAGRFAAPAADAVALAAGGVAAARAALGGTPGLLGGSTGRRAGVAGVALSLLVVAVVAGVLNPAGGLAPAVGGGVATPAPTPSPAAGFDTPAATATARLVPAACPSPPESAAPSQLRPPVIETASVRGLEGWTLEASLNITDFDLQDQRAGVVPEERWTGTYASPAGEGYRVVIDRWETPDRAVEAMDFVAEGDARMAWGRYTVVVNGHGENASIPAVRAVLLAVSAPGDGGLGRACVGELAEFDLDGVSPPQEAVTTTTTTTTPTPGGGGH